MSDEDLCSTCGAGANEFCHLDGNHDDAYEMGMARGIKAGAAADVQLVAEWLRGIAERGRDNSPPWVEEGESTMYDADWLADAIERHEHLKAKENA